MKVLINSTIEGGEVYFEEFKRHRVLKKFVAYVRERWADEEGLKCKQGLRDTLTRLTEKVERANAIQHSGGVIQPEDWNELYRLTNEVIGILAKAKGAL